MTTQNEHYKKQVERVIPFANLEDLPEVVKDQMARLSKSAKNICVLYVGGTLGMCQNKEGQLVPTNDVGELLKPLTIKGLDKEVHVTWFQITPHAIDSTNGRWVHWVTIGNAIRLLYDRFDGFVVVSGTDTMSQMTAAIHLMFPNIGKPVICTGSQLPMFRMGDDATRNLYFSLSAACQDLSGIYLAFADMLIHGFHVFKVKDKAAKAFDCPPHCVLGEFDGEVRIYKHAPRRYTIIDSNRLIYRPFFREGIKVVRISPATGSASLVYDGHDPDCSILLIITYGAGNVRDESSYEAEITHLEGIQTLRGEGIPVVLGSPMMDGKVDSPYAGGAKAVSEEFGAISAGGITGPALEVVCMFCLHQAWEGNKVNSDKFRELIYQQVKELDMER